MAVTTTTTQQFATAKAFADYMCRERWGTKQVRWLNAASGQTRLEWLKRDCERYSRWRLDEGGIEFGYNPASYGLWWAVSTGRLNGEATKAILSLNIRQLCELVHVLLVECGPTTEGYARFLMQRFIRGGR